MSIKKEHNRTSLGLLINQANSGVSLITSQVINHPLNPVIPTNILVKTALDTVRGLVDKFSQVVRNKFAIPTSILRAIAYRTATEKEAPPDSDGEVDSYLLETPVLLPVGHNLWRCRSMPPNTYTTLLGALQLSGDGEPIQRYTVRSPPGLEPPLMHVPVQFMNYRHALEATEPMHHKEAMQKMLYKGSASPVSSEYEQFLVYSTNDHFTLLYLEPSSQKEPKVEFFGQRDYCYWNSDSQSMMLRMQQTVKPIETISRKKIIEIFEVFDDEVARQTSLVRVFKKYRKVWINENSTFLAAQLASLAFKEYVVRTAKLCHGYITSEFEDPKTHTGNIVMKTCLVATKNLLNPTLKEDVEIFVPIEVFAEWVYRVPALTKLLFSVNKLGVESLWRDMAESSEKGELVNNSGSMETFFKKCILDTKLQMPYAARALPSVSAGGEDREPAVCHFELHGSINNSVPPKALSANELLYHYRKAYSFVASKTQM